jgi:hypothetical protein
MDDPGGRDDEMTSRTNRDGWPVLPPDPRKYDNRNRPVAKTPDALTLCNSCDAAPALPTSAAGYCAECMDGLSETEKRYLDGDR